MVPDDVAQFGRGAAKRLHDVLGEELVGVYFVGSAALGGYVPGESDTDIVAVSRDRVGYSEKQAIVETRPRPRRARFIRRSESA